MFRNPSFTLLEGSSIPVVLAFNDQDLGAVYLSSDRIGSSWTQIIIDINNNYLRANRAVLDTFPAYPKMVVAQIFPNRSWRRIVSTDGGSTWGAQVPIGPDGEFTNLADDVLSVGLKVNGRPTVVYVIGNSTDLVLLFSRSLDAFGLTWGASTPCGLNGCQPDGQFEGGQTIQGDLEITTQITVNVVASAINGTTIIPLMVTGVCIINDGSILQVGLGNFTAFSAGSSLPILLCLGGIAGTFSGSAVTGNCVGSIQSEVQQTSTLSSVLIVSSSSSTTTSQCGTSSGGLSTGAIIGIAAGCVVAGVLLAVLIALCLRREKKRNQKLMKIYAMERTLDN